MTTAELVVAFAIWKAPVTAKVAVVAERTPLYVFALLACFSTRCRPCLLPEPVIFFPFLLLRSRHAVDTRSF
ncbi:hypothetical protein [Streptomyces sp. NPDC007205]|uniref:hypothetical protein n=1 Tax=Streptomyces sp. NPDC007205 TaxID=3154316 RepID=UPI0033E2169F